jgi:DNA-directed RNA polymerase specialized sigma24 family protein
LAEFDGSPSAEHLARLEVDGELATQLMLARYEGPLWKKFATTLARYGMPVIWTWVRYGKIFRHCEEKGLGALDLGNYTDEEKEQLAEDVVGETVGKAIEGFRVNVLMRGRWRPARGASLNTFFIGQCILQFPNVYRSWRRAFISAKKVRRAVRQVDPDFIARATPVDVAADVRMQLAKRIVGRPDIALIRALGSKGWGLTSAEIGQILGMTPGALQQRLYRERLKMKKEGPND